MFYWLFISFASYSCKEHTYSFLFLLEQLHPQLETGSDKLCFVTRRNTESRKRASGVHFPFCTTPCKDRTQEQSWSAAKGRLAVTTTGAAFWGTMEPLIPTNRKMGSLPVTSYKGAQDLPFFFLHLPLTSAHLCDDL